MRWRADSMLHSNSPSSTTQLLAQSNPSHIVAPWNQHKFWYVQTCSHLKCHPNTPYGIRKTISRLCRWAYHCHCHNHLRTPRRRILSERTALRESAMEISLYVFHVRSARCKHLSTHLCSPFSLFLFNKIRFDHEYTTHRPVTWLIRW